MNASSREEELAALERLILENEVALVRSTLPTIDLSDAQGTLKAALTLNDLTIAELLLQNGVPIHKTVGFYDPLIDAIIHDKSEVKALLMRYGADQEVASRLRAGNRYLIEIAEMASATPVNALLDHGLSVPFLKDELVRVCTEYGESSAVFIMAVTRFHLEPGRDDLIRAALEGYNIAVLAYMHEQGVDLSRQITVNASSGRMQSPLSYTLSRRAVIGKTLLSLGITVTSEELDKALYSSEGMNIRIAADIIVRHPHLLVGTNTSRVMSSLIRGGDFIDAIQVVERYCDEANIAKFPALNWLEDATNYRRAALINYYAETLSDEDMLHFCQQREVQGDTPEDILTVLRKITLDKSGVLQKTHTGRKKMTL